MDVEQLWNKPESGKLKHPEESLLSMTCSTTYSKSTRLVLSWSTVRRVSRLGYVVAMKNRFNFCHLLAI